MTVPTPGALLPALADGPGGGVTKALLPAAQQTMTPLQITILCIALAAKGGLLGVYLPFGTLWLDSKGYTPADLALLVMVDSCGSLLLPLINGIVDHLRSHNTSFVLMMLALAVLKISYVPLASHFYLLLFLALVTAPILRSATSVLDSMALYAFADKGNFGRARLFGELGWGALALLTGWAIDVYKTTDVMFVLFSSTCVFLAVLWMAARPWMSSIRPDTRAIPVEEFVLQAKLVAGRFKSEGGIRMWLALTLLGMAGNIHGAFELVLVKQMVGDGTTMGIAKALGSLASLPTWYYMGPLLDRIGFHNVQLIAFGTTGLRHLLLGCIWAPHQIFVTEALAGFGGFAIAYCSITVVLGRAIDEDLKSTAQSLILTVYGCVGGVGPMLASSVVESWGIQAMFRVVGFSLIITFCILGIYDAARWYFGTYKTFEVELAGTTTPPPKAYFEQPHQCA